MPIVVSHQERPMPITATVETVVVNPDGSGELILDRTPDVLGRDRVRFRSAPEEVTALNGVPVGFWAASGAPDGITFFLSVAGIHVAHMGTDGLVHFEPRDVFVAAVQAYRGVGLWDDPIDGGLPVPGDMPVAGDDDRPGGPEPFDVYRHWKPYRGLYAVVCRSVNGETREQLVTYRSCKNRTVWTRTLAYFLAVVTDADGRRVPRFTRVEE